MNTDRPSRKFRWLKILGVVFGVLLVLLVVTYFVATSAWCLKSVILPRVSTATGATITVEDASISPFSSVALTGLRIQTTGAEPLFTAKSILARYSLMAILRGHIKVEEVSLNEPVIRVVMNADGTSNLDAFTKKPAVEKAPAPAPPGEPTQLDLKKIAINNATILFSQHQTNGEVLSAELSRVNFTLSDVKNGQAAKLALGMALHLSTGSATNTAEIAASFNSAFDLSLKPDLMPKQVSGSADVTVSQATGAFAEVAQLNTKLALDLSLEDIKQLSVNFTKGEAGVGAINVSGPFDMMEREGKLKISVTGIGYEVLSLVGGRFGIFFGGTKLAANYEIELKDRGQFINTIGTITADKFSLTRSNLTTPVIDMQLGYNATVDLIKTNAVLRAFTFDVKQTNRSLITAALSKEMVINWGRGSEGVAESTLQLDLNQLDLADWKAFLGSNVTAGIVSGRLLVNVQQAGKQIRLDLDSRLTELSVGLGRTSVTNASVAFAVRGQMADFTKLTLAELRASVTNEGKTVVAFKGSGRLDTATMDADLDTELDASLVEAVKFVPMPDLALSDGVVSFKGRISQKNLTPAQAKAPSMDQTVTGTLKLANFTGRFASNVFDRFETAVDLSLALKENVAQIKQCSGALKQAGQPGGAFDVTGNYQLTNGAGEVTLKLTDLNQVVLRSFVAAALGERKLDSVSISANTTARYDAKAGSGVRGNVQVVNLLITDPKGQLPKIPLSVEVALDAALTGQGVAGIKQFAGAVRASDQPAGSFEVSGHYDLTNQSGLVTFKLIDLNQNALRPFVAPALGDKDLKSVSIYADATARYAARGDSAAKGTLIITNLLVIDPSGSVPTTPLAVGLALDATFFKQILDLRQLQLTLAPTDRAKNQLQFAGKVDLTKTNLYSGNLKLSADSLDFTAYYDMFVTDKPTNAPAAAKPEARPAPATASTAPLPPAEPPAMTNIPLREFTFEAEIGRLFLRDIAISSVLVRTRVDGGKIDVDPFQLLLNGAPVSAKIALDLGVPGYVYDVNFLADKVPLTPLADSFQPSQRGQVGGTLSANLQIKGAGATGPSLQKNLAGHFDLGATNLNYRIDQIKMPVLTKVLDAIVGIPDAISSPGKAVTGLFSRLTGGAKSSNGGWVEELMQSPLDIAAVRAEAGHGKIELQQVFAQSPAFQTDVHGTITLAPELTNSVMVLPVQVTLRRSLAQKVGLAGDTPTNAPYAKLPDFLTMTGTLGNPKPDIKYGALVAVAAKATIGTARNIGAAAIGGIGAAASGLLNLGGGSAIPAVPAVAAPALPSPSLLAQPSTNAPSTTVTNVPVLNNPIKGFGIGK